MRRIALFEDQATDQFSPIALLRPVFELLCGHYSLRERLLRTLKVSEWGAFIRPELQNVYQAEHPDAHLNNADWSSQQPTLFINGRWLVNPHDVVEIKPGTAGWAGDVLAYVYLPAGARLSGSHASLDEELTVLAKDCKSFEIDSCVLNFPWDLFSANLKWLNYDFLNRDKSHIASKITPQVAIVGDSKNVYIDSTATLDPYVVIDVSNGPVWIDAGAKIQAFTRLEGPCYIGQKTQLFRANVREGCSIGPVCRVGGEIEESLFHGYANKYHDGFLGHSYVCPWVNLGALTTNSDLKNDYSSVKVPLSGISLDTGTTKIGCFIGDHTKTALCSLFNTGSSIGVMCLILPGGELLPKHVPSFSRVWHGRLEQLPDGTSSAMHTARYAMGRREQVLSPHMEQLLNFVFEKTQAERTRAFARQLSSS